MDLVGAFLGVIAIIGIVIVGGFVIFFLGDLVLSILDPNYVRFGNKKKKKENKNDNDIKKEFDDFINQKKEKIDGPKQETKEISFDLENEKLDIKTAPVIEEGLGDNFFDNAEEVKKEEAFEEKKSNDLDALRAEEEQFKQNMLKAIQERRTQNQVSTENEEEIDLDKFFFGEDENFERNPFEENSQIEGQENLEDLLNKDEENIEEDKKIDFEEIPVEQLMENPELDKEEIENEDEIQEDKIENEEIDKSNEEIESEETKEELITDIDSEKITEDKVQVENIDEDKEENFDGKGSYLEVDNLIDQYEAEIAKLKNEKLVVEQENRKLKKEHEEAKEEIANLVEEKKSIVKKKISDNQIGTNSNIEEYEADLEKLKERLAENDKDLRKVKKEFIPLKKVYKTLENDEKKLRRREAIVAKQKVELYGVNNIVDIDQTKAKKLTEELDLLEGLKLSVKHCEEVMTANKERYPILENTYNILLRENKSLKEDIEELESKIAKLKKD